MLPIFLCAYLSFLYFGWSSFSNLLLIKKDLIVSLLTFERGVCVYKSFIKYIPLFKKKMLRLRWQRVEIWGWWFVSLLSYTHSASGSLVSLSGGNTLGHDTDSIVVMWAFGKAYRDHILTRMNWGRTTSWLSHVMDRTVGELMWDTIKDFQEKLGETFNRQEKSYITRWAHKPPSHS